jgi:hypothetical protein
LSEEHDIKAVSPEAWRAFYWSAPYPNLKSLAIRFGVTHSTVAAYLRRAGVKVRSRATQMSLDVKYGRMPKPPSARGQKRDFSYAERMRALNISRRGQALKKGQHEKLEIAIRTRFQLPCVWCGELLWVAPHHYRENPNRACCGSHGALHRSFRERMGYDAPRPLILAKLRDLLREHPYKALPFTRETLEKAGATIGAGEPEIIEVMLEART